MQKSHPAAIKISEELQIRLDELCPLIYKCCGDNLQSILLYGGVYKELFEQSNSEVNLLIVVSEIGLSLLEAISPVITEAEFKLKVSPILVTENDLIYSQNLFPVKFLDIQKNHQLLWGKDYFLDFTANDDDLKRNCQRELKNLCLQSNQIFIRNYHYPEILETRLINIFSSFILNLNALLFIKTGLWYSSKEEILKATIGALDLPPLSMLRLFEIKPGARLDKQEILFLYSEYLNSIKTVSHIADQL